VDNEQKKLARIYYINGHRMSKEIIPGQISESANKFGKVIPIKFGKLRRKSKPTLK